MNGKTDIHPDVVLEALLAKGARSNRRANLAKMHELCCKQHETGSRDFSLPAIGRLAEADDIMKGRALYTWHDSVASRATLISIDLQVTQAVLQNRNFVLIHSSSYLRSGPTPDSQPTSA